MDKLELEFKKRVPWHTGFIINGKQYGGETLHNKNKRIDWFFNAFPNAKNILELSSLEGGLTFRLAERADCVIAIEGRAENIERAQFVQKAMKITNVRFIQADLETDAWLSLIDKKIDTVFCSGILYHLTKPWELIEKSRTIADKIFIWGKYASRDVPVGEYKIIENYTGKWFMDIPNSRKAGLNPHCFWLDLPNLFSVITKHFPIVKVYQHDPLYKEGANITLAAWN